MLQILKNPKARAAIGLSFFAGLVPSEGEGAEVGRMHCHHAASEGSVYRIHVGPTKTSAREAAIPICEPLRKILDELRRADGNPGSGWILRAANGGELPLDLNKLARRVIAPALKRAGIQWHGFRPQRTGVITAITGLSHDGGLAAKGLARHSNIATTAAHYIQSIPEATVQATIQLGQA